MQTLIVIIILVLAGAFLVFTLVRPAKKSACGSCRACSRGAVLPNAGGVCKTSACSGKLGTSKNQARAKDFFINHTS